MTIRLLLADDHAILRDGLHALLQSQVGLQVVGDASNGQEAVALARRLRPDVAVLDVAMPRLNGLEAAEIIRAECPDTQLIVLSMHATREHIFHALRLGVKGYLLKESLGRDVVEAIRAVHAGQRFLSPAVAQLALDDYVDRSRTEQFGSPLDRLSPHERQVLQFLADGLPNTVIAERLSLSVKTVETYRARLMRKLEIFDVPGLVKFALRHGLTSLDGPGMEASAG